MKHLLVAASALVVGLSFAGTAFANGDRDDHHNNSLLSANAALAASVQANGVFFNFALGTDAANSISDVHAIGLVNIQQNGGANSNQADANTLAAVLTQSCGCGNGALISVNVPVAATVQVGAVAGNTSIGALNVAKTGVDEGSGWHVDHVFAAEQSAGFIAGSHYGFIGAGEQSALLAASSAGGGQHFRAWDNQYDWQQSTNTLHNSNFTGMINVSQNVGNNSLQQAANTASVIIQH
jgi:hypothetical protein